MTYKDFGKSFYEVWADAYHNYTTILVSVFGREVLDLYSALAEFYTNIYKLSTVYEWQEAVFPMAIEADTFIVAKQPKDPSKCVISEKFQGKFWTARTMIEMGSIMSAGAKKKRSRSLAGAQCGRLSGSNNPSISCKLFNKGSCDWPPCNRAHKCKKCGSRDHGLSECTAKGKKKSWQLVGDTKVVSEEVEVVEVASLANRNDLYQFIHAYPCLSALSRPNTFIKFRLVDTSKPLLTNSPSPLKPGAWADLLVRYPGSQRICLQMVLRFGVELGYEGPKAFILSDNLTSALEDPTIIEKKLQEDLASGCVTPMHQSSWPFIYSPLGLVPKHDGSWKKIHHLSHPRGESMKDYIPNGVDEMRYTPFQEVLQLVINAGRHWIIMKKDVNDTFRNVPVTT